MSGDHHHFPTFHKIGSAFRPSSGFLARWIIDHICNERGLLRVAFVVVMLATVLHAVCARYLEATYGMNYGVPVFIRGATFATPGDLPEAGLAGAIYSITKYVFGPNMGENSIIVILGCLLGFAVTNRTPLRRPTRPVERFPRAVVTAGPLEPDAPRPAPVPPSPPRHPLDPDPDDMPLEPRWRNTFKPSK
jgi:hypothetical protein